MNDAFDDIRAMRISVDNNGAFVFVRYFRNYGPAIYEASVIVPKYSIIQANTFFTYQHWTNDATYELVLDGVVIQRILANTHTEILEPNIDLYQFYCDTDKRITIRMIVTTPGNGLSISYMTFFENKSQDEALIPQLELE